MNEEIVEDCPSDKYITPNCCEMVKKTSAIFIYIDWDENDGKPYWGIRTYFSPYDCESVREAKVCPFCATPLPKIVPSGETRPIANTENGYYCETCKERSCACTCLSPDKAWKPES